MGLVSSFIEYKTIEEERCPSIGIYYVFRGYDWPKAELGLCRQFRFDLESVRKIVKRTGILPRVVENPELVINECCFNFRDENLLLNYLNRNGIQAIKTGVFDKISFNQLSFIIAQIHFDDFLRRHRWVID